jgi:hypothetical protein
MVLGGFALMNYALDLTVEAGGKSANLSLKSVNQHDKNQVLNLIAQLFEVELKVVTLNIVKDDPKPPKIFPNKPVDVSNESVKPSTSRKLPLIDSNRSEIVSVGEKLQAALNPNDEPEFYKTGIKIDEDGTKRYKCRYTCQCGRKGNHYIPLKTPEVWCHDCEEPLEVGLAAGEVDAKGIPVRDDFGNYYYAHSKRD